MTEEHTDHADIYIPASLMKRVEVIAQRLETTPETLVNRVVRAAVAGEAVVNGDVVTEQAGEAG